MLMNQPDAAEEAKAETGAASKSKSKTKKADSVKPELELFNFEPKSVSHE